MYLVLGLALIFQMVNRLYTKHVLSKGDPLALFVFTSFFGALCVLFYILLVSKSTVVVTPLVLATLFGSGALWAVSGYLQNIAVKETPLSVYSIVSQFQIIWVVLAGVIVFSERLSALGVLGVVLIVVSCILVSYRSLFTKEISLRSFLLVFLTSLAVGVTVVVDTYAVKNIPVDHYFFAVLLIPSLILMPKLFTRKTYYFDNIKTHLLSYTISTVALVVSYGATLLVFAHPQLPISVSYPILRAGGIISVILAVIIFKEKTSWPLKILAIIMGTCGAVLVKVF